MKQSQFYYLLRRGLFSAGSAIIKNGLVMFNKFTTAGISHPAQGSAEFNGTSDYVQLPDPFNHTNHTIAAWVYVNSTGGGKFIFDARDADDDGIRMEITGSNYPKYSLNAADVQYTTAFTNEWIYMVASYDGTTQKLYVDGSLVVSNATSQSVSTTTDARIGAQSYSLANYINGNLANVAIWNRALSSDEINSVMWKSYEALSGAESNGLKAWYSLDDITSPAASLANMEQLATDKNATIENKAAVTAAINALS
eukprot:GHVU01078982.1.p1 GENE.GHVU01078982.1~~GHVU01078982.1.p1  ORF type:complete len:254 (-),score=15.00 GHVU01078982.1:273-1034(-)